MTAEEYLTDRYNTYKDWKIDFQLDDMYELSKYAIIIARQEEREKAVKAFCIASGCEDAKDCHATYCLEKDRFEKLINQ